MGSPISCHWPVPIPSENTEKPLEREQWHQTAKAVIKRCSIKEGVFFSF